MKECCGYLCEMCCYIVIVAFRIGTSGFRSTAHLSWQRASHKRPFNECSKLQMMKIANCALKAVIIQYHFLPLYVISQLKLLRQSYCSAFMCVYGDKWIMLTTM